MTRDGQVVNRKRGTCGRNRDTRHLRARARSCLVIAVIFALVSGKGSSEVDETASEPFPLRAALGAMGRGDIGDAHYILGQMARQGSAKTLAELQSSAGYGRALLPLFDALGAALTVAPTEHRIWEMLVWCQSLWVDAMLSLDSLRVFLPAQLGARLRAPSSGKDRRAQGNETTGTWQQIELRKVDLSSDSGILSLTFARPVKLVRRPRTQTERLDGGVERVELGIGRTGVGMWAMHDEIAWADCQPDDALVPPHNVLCLSATGNTWFGTRGPSDPPGLPARQLSAPDDGDAAYILDAVEMALLRERLGSGAARAPSPFLYQTWQAHGQLSATWLQTWIATLPHTAKVPWRLADAAARRQHAARAMGDNGGPETGSTPLGKDVEAARFYAGSLQRIVPALTAGRPFSKLRQESVDATALAALTSLWRCEGGVRKRFPASELWWRPPVVTPAVSANSSSYPACQWAISAGTQVLEEAGQALEKPAVGLRLRLLHLLFLRTHVAEVGGGGEVERLCRDDAAGRARNAHVFREYSTDFAGYMAEDIALARLLTAYRRAREELSAGGISSERESHRRGIGAGPTVKQFVIDVGANGCELSVEIGKALGRDVVIAALEPLPALAAICSRVLWRVAEREHWDISHLSSSADGSSLAVAGLFQLQIMQYAVSNVTGETKRLHLASAGLGCDRSRGQCTSAGNEVTTVTVDDLASSLDLLPEDSPGGEGEAIHVDGEGAGGPTASRLPDSAGKEIVMVKVDVEGWEVAVIQGMRRMLEKRAVHLVVFETGSTWEDDRAAVRGTSLRAVVADFSRTGYRCFYIGVRFLLPISAPFEHEIYDENKQHRNVLCALSAPWLPALLRKYAWARAPAVCA